MNRYLIVVEVFERDPRGYAVGAFCPLVVSPVADFVLGEGQSDSKTPMSVRTREQGYRGPFTGCAAAKGRDPGRPIPSYQNQH